MKDAEEKISLALEYLRGNLTEEQIRRAEQLLENDNEFREIYATLKSLREETGDNDLGEVTRSLKKLAGQMFDDFKRGRSKKDKTGVRVFDSGMMPLPEGVRPAKVDTRRLKYRAGERELELMLYPVSPESYEVIGQISDVKAGDRCEVCFIDGKQMYHAVADVHGLFQVPRLPLAVYRIKVTMKKEVVAEFKLEI